MDDCLWWFGYCGSLTFGLVGVGCRFIAGWIALWGAFVARGLCGCRFAVWVLFCILWLIVLDTFVVCVRFCCLLVVVFIALMCA